MNREVVQSIRVGQPNTKQGKQKWTFALFFKESTRRPFCLFAVPPPVFVSFSLSGIKQQHVVLFLICSFAAHILFPTFFLSSVCGGVTTPSTSFPFFSPTPTASLFMLCCHLGRLIYFGLIKHVWELLLLHMGFDLLQRAAGLDLALLLCHLCLFLSMFDTRWVPCCFVLLSAVQLFSLLLF